MRCLTRVGIIQLRSEVGASQDNLGRALAGLEEAAQRRCELVCLPEAFATTIDLKGIRRLAEPIPGPLTETLGRAAKRHGFHIVAGMIEADGDDCYSAAVLIDGDGNLLGSYRRIHLYRLEKGFLHQGEALSQVYETGVGRIGMIIGYDLNFPETCRNLFQHQVEILVCPAQIPLPFAAATLRLTVARAVENCCYVVFASSVGENIMARFHYMGGSRIVRNPVALDRFSFDYVQVEELIARDAGGEEMVIANLDLKRLRREQKENPHAKDVRFLPPRLEDQRRC